MVRLFRGTCLAVRAMHEYRPTTPRSAVASKKGGASGKPKQQAHVEDDEDHDERFPQAEGDAEGGYSYDGPSSSTPLVTKHQAEEEGEVVFDGDEELENAQQGNSTLEVVPYAHRDLKPGYVTAPNSTGCLPNRYVLDAAIS